MWIQCFGFKWKFIKIFAFVLRFTSVTGRNLQNRTDRAAPFYHEPTNEITENRLSEFSKVNDGSLFEFGNGGGDESRQETPPAAMPMTPPAAMPMTPPAAMPMTPPAAMPMTPPAAMPMTPPAAMPMTPPAAMQMTPPAAMQMTPPAARPPAQAAAAPARPAAGGQGGPGFTASAGPGGIMAALSTGLGGIGSPGSGSGFGLGGSGIRLQDLIAMAAAVFGSVLAVGTVGFLAAMVGMSEVRRTAVADRFDEDEEALQSIYSLTRRCRYDGQGCFGIIDTGIRR